ncbi:hypothetical protein EPYR_02209 [Erwinia pyrifoliae DSM 12163]|nr:hypothetical protein EPYR_02209 [Erwinia pyrifoliae DSM 12163]
MMTKALLPHFAKLTQCWRKQTRRDLNAENFLKL